MYFPFISSSLTGKILSVNLLALIILVGGTFYISQYQKDLIASAEQKLLAETLLFASILQESTAESDREIKPRSTILGAGFILDRARRIVDALSDNSATRIRLYDIEDRIMVDSRLRGGAGGQHGGFVEIEPLDPIEEQNPNQQDIGRSLNKTFADLVGRIPVRIDLPVLSVQQISASDNLSNQLRAQGIPIQGDGAGTRVGAFLISEEILAASGPAPGIFLAAAAPVYNEGGYAVGEILVSRRGDDIVAAITRARLDVLKISSLAFLTTLMLSLYLARAIGHPLRQLAKATRKIREGNRLAGIPTYPRRLDEIGSLSLALQDMTHALGERLDTIEKFAGDVSHELKNPLSSMRSATETLQRYLGNEKNAKDSSKNRESVETLLDVLMHDIERMNRLITDIARTSRLDVALEREGRSVVDLGDMLEAIIGMHDRLGAGIILRLIREDPSKSYAIKGNADRLAQLFQNLIDNAMSFSHTGSQVKIYLKHDKDWVLIEVEDMGPGIPPDKTEAIFERFYSERPGHENYGEHSGLGLAIARQIIEAHHGDIRAENIIKDGHTTGARFILRLPAV